MNLVHLGAVRGANLFYMSLFSLMIPIISGVLRCMGLLSSHLFVILRRF